jgi:hypothetical protein
MILLMLITAVLGILFTAYAISVSGKPRNVIDAHEARPAYLEKHSANAERPVLETTLDH